MCTASNPQTQTRGKGSALRLWLAPVSKTQSAAPALPPVTPGADVYSYAPDEDDMVTDPHLDKHLAHWGINMLQVGASRGGGAGSCCWAAACMLGAPGAVEH